MTDIAGRNRIKTQTRSGNYDIVNSRSVNPVRLRLYNDRSFKHNLVTYRED